MDKAFRELRSSLCNNVVLCVPSVSDTYSLHTDASGAGLGSILHVVREGKEIPVAFRSRQLNKAEKNYSATELELLAVVDAVTHFLYYLHGRSFSVYTDHRALCFLYCSPILSRCLRGMLLNLIDFDITFIHKSGSDNVNTDALSRQAWKEPDQTYACTAEEVKIEGGANRYVRPSLYSGNSRGFASERGDVGQDISNKQGNPLED